MSVRVRVPRAARAEAYRAFLGFRRLVSEPFGVSRECSSASECAEEVGGVFVVESPGGALGVDGHAADRVDRKSAVRGAPLADCRHELDRIAEVAERLPSPRLV